MKKFKLLYGRPPQTFNCRCSIKPLPDGNKPSGKSFHQLMKELKYVKPR